MIPASVIKYTLNYDKENVKRPIYGGEIADNNSPNLIARSNFVMLDTLFVLVVK